MHTCGALCTESADTCSSSVKNIVTNMIALSVAVAGAVLGMQIDIIGIIKSLGGTALELANAICDKPTTIEFFTMQ